MNPTPPWLAEAPQARRRRRYIDWARALAVLVMIQAHTLDSWVRPADRGTHVFKNLMVLGGLAAPMFLWLAGLALVLATERAVARTGDRRGAASAACRRALEIFILAFLFRLQAFIVTPGSPLVRLFRVDILNVMGPALLAAGVLWGLVANPTALTISYAVAAVAVAMLTPILRVANWIGAMPVWVQWYLRPAGEHTTFTLFPWSGFVFAGAAIGMLLARARNQRAERRLQLALAFTGLAIAELGVYTASLAPIYRESSFWSSSPTYFAIRVGVIMVTLATLYAADITLSRWAITLAPLGRLGASSLFVYWVHVELVYGYASGPLHRRLSLGQTAIAYVLFCGAMYGAILLRDRVADAWSRRRQDGASSTASVSI